VTITEPGHKEQRSCLNPGRSQIALIPSDDYSKATLNLDRPDLKWVSILTPYVAEYRNSNGQWTPKLCIADQGCMDGRMKLPFWLYVPSRKLFVLIESAGSSVFNPDNFAHRPEDKLF
jgi:hypothetical protein